MLRDQHEQRVAQDMNTRIRAIAMATLLVCPCVQAAQPQERDCNQLGREIALRAAEQMPQSFDSAARSRLAAIAEGACVEFSTDVAATPVGAPAASPAPEAADDGQASLFDVELIAPEDRVRRPGLKRR